MGKVEKVLVMYNLHSTLERAITSMNLKLHGTHRLGTPLPSLPQMLQVNMIDLPMGGHGIQLQVVQKLGCLRIGLDWVWAQPALADLIRWRIPQPTSN